MKTGKDHAGNNKGEYYFLNEDNNVELKEIYWSPNKLVFSIHTRNETIDNTLILNQNYYPGWVVTKDGNKCQRVTNLNGLLATKIEKSYSQVIYKYDPFEFYLVCR